MKTRSSICVALLALGVTNIHAQDIYKVENFAGTDLSGTSRYVGMGGAMNALGGDISTIATNPAAIGLFRRSDISMTGSLQIQPSAEDFSGIGKTRASFDQIGFVYSVPFNNSSLKNFNFGFNYQKRRNFKNFVSALGVATHGLSQSLQMLDLAYVGNGWLDLSNEKDRELTTPLTNLGYDTQMLYPIYDAEGKVTGYEPVAAQSYDYKRAQWGGIQQYDFNLSGNWNHQIYAGLTFGVQHIDFNGATYYSEQLLDEQGGTHPYFTEQRESIGGTGFDLKFGVILRPIEENPFRIGFSVHTPTWFQLEHNSYLYMQSPFESDNAPYTEQDVSISYYNYNINTPWKFNLSLGTTIGNFLALDAEYEYANYSSSSISYDYYEGWGGTIGKMSDLALNDENERFLKSVSTIRVGAEARFTPNTYLRLGYNHVTAPIAQDAYLNLFTNSDSYYYSTNTDYVNLGAINRVTAGLGWRGKKFYADAAYQYQMQDGDLYTFHVPADGSEANRLNAQKINLDRHSLQLTLGYRF